jgi:hypothetical protein
MTQQPMTDAERSQHQAAQIREWDTAFEDYSDSELARIVRDDGQPTQGTPTDQQRRAWRAANTLAIRARATRQADAQAAEQQKMNAQNQQALDAYRTTARGAFPGTDEAFTRLWPQLRDQWLVEQTQTKLGSEAERLARKRASFDYGL